MLFRTEYKANKSELTLSPFKPAALAGSCFSENIADRMSRTLWRAVNPLGNLYNPLSIAKALRLTLLSHFSESEFEKSLFLADNKYRSWLFDSRLSSYCAPDSMAAFRKMRAIFLETVSEGQTLILTFGTSYTYFLKGRKDYAVGNCHKQPDSIFERRRLSTDEIIKEWTTLINDLKKKFTGLNIIFTVSPVRHLKDGFHENTLSKATLLMAIESLCEQFQFCRYFPAFEIVNDDLRDYRFYADDLLHPSNEAIDYIWEIFKETFLNMEGKERIKQGEKLYKALNHKKLPDSSRLIPEDILAEEELHRKKLLKDYEDFLNH